MICAANMQSDPQKNYYCINAAKQAHADVHRALRELESNGSKQDAKRLLGQAIKKLTQALVEL